MIGLLWLKLLNKNVDSLIPRDQSFEDIYPKIIEFKQNLNNVNNFQLIEMLLDLEKHPNLQLENVILEFDQWIIIVIKKQEELGSSEANDNERKRENGAFGEMHTDDNQEYQYGMQENEENNQNQTHQVGEVVRKNLNNNITRSKTEISAQKNIFAEIATETENDTPNASKSIIKVHNGNISLAGDENSILQKLNDTTESDINNSRFEQGDLRNKGITFGGKKGNSGTNKILEDEFVSLGGVNEQIMEVREESQETNNRKSTNNNSSNKIKNDFEPKKLVSPENMGKNFNQIVIKDQTQLHREVIYDQKSELIKQREDQEGGTRYSNQPQINNKLSNNTDSKPQSLSNKQRQNGKHSEGIGNFNSGINNNYQEKEYLWKVGLEEKLLDQEKKGLIMMDPNLAIILSKKV